MNNRMSLTEGRVPVLKALDRETGEDAWAARATRYGVSIETAEPDHGIFLPWGHLEKLRKDSDAYFTELDERRNAQGGEAW